MFENIVGKGENTGNQRFFPFPKIFCFLLKQIIVAPSVHIYDIILLFAAELVDPKIGISGKGFKPYNVSKLQKAMGNLLKGVNVKITRCVCETRMPPKRPFFEKCNLYI